jgi:hypothetical protein
VRTQDAHFQGRWAGYGQTKTVLDGAAFACLQSNSWLIYCRSGMLVFVLLLCSSAHGCVA